MKKCFLLLILLLSIASFATAQRTIKGTISSSDGEPLVGASIVVKGANTGAITDVDGKFTLEVPKDAQKLVFSFVGYQSQVGRG